MSESPLLRKILLRASALGMRLFRNQTGKYQLPDGRWLSSGLCVGSSDLIGWTPVVVTESMVGTTVAIFTAIETKVGHNVASSAQSKFLAAVVAAGGLARVARTVEDIESVTQGVVADAVPSRARRVSREGRQYPVGHVAPSDQASRTRS